MAENGEELENEPGETEIPEGGPGLGLPAVPSIPAYKRAEKPTGTMDQIKWWALKGKTRKELEAAPYNFKPGSIRVAFRQLVEKGELVEKLGEPKAKEEKMLPAIQTAKGMQVFAKGSPPEAIIESIRIPQVDGQAEGFEKGMKFGMSTIVLAIRVMQEMSAISLQQVQPLIALTRTVREGEQAAFKGGAEEGAMKAARAMGDTIMPMMSEMQASIASAARGSEADPFKSMLTRMMEPLIKNMIGKMIPGVQEQPPSGWVRKQE